MAAVVQAPSSRAGSEERHQVVGPTVVEHPQVLPWLHMASVVGLPSLEYAAQPVASVLVACEASADPAVLEALTSVTSVPVGAASVLS